jgi:hypothetical protein
MLMVRLVMGGSRSHLFFVVFLGVVIAVFTDLGLDVYMLFVVEIFCIVVSEAVSIKHFSCLLSGFNHTLE